MVVAGARGCGWSGRKTLVRGGGVLVGGGWDLKREAA
jgi:hypothetical protein